MSRPILVLVVLVMACGERPVTAKSDDLCDFEERTCKLDGGGTLEFYVRPDACEESLAQWEECGLTRNDVKGCVDAVERCEPLPIENCQPRDGIECQIPECEALYWCGATMP